ncbi:MAG: nascent polypeptide-associated complex protein [Candidatus Lokiarchaeia archaeon]|nr:nascent polypeptide-associated complex protein [Candidatus Lokiarchaeia archaeon]
MVKLPKEMQNKAKSKPKRPQPVAKREGQQFGSRQMRRRMAQQGIDMDQIDATRVIIEGPEKTLIIEQPEVFLMKQAGQEMYQVIGQGEEVSPEELIIETGGTSDELTQIEETEMKATITENDIMLVATQANVDKQEAETILKEYNGDIAKAILYFKNRP